MYNKYNNVAFKLIEIENMRRVCCRYTRAKCQPYLTYN